ncbi:hypothetical protein KVR01_009387 [Diaporthe batatas]|uniref:uncharacterized protein n=1 Tax=Diaporthe batatas TaxID=748121 RepID=UPI001D0489C8|nr:uncharacterized protein KVR01_009387 [Diaporthe batatas]KAG8161123.1 hypothetical protein KVR01_009387 [Diaporthe batatas]
MSGLEIAGLVLGALPFVLKSVDAYRDGFRRIGTTFNKRQHVAKLARALRLQQHTLEELIKSILLDSGFEDALALDDDPVGFLNDSEVQEQVEDYLGLKNTSFLIDELTANIEAVGKVARCISGLVPGLEGPKDDLVAIIQANQDKPSLMADLGPRLKLVLGITDMKEMIQEIDKCSNALERFSKLALSNCQAMNSNSSRKSQKLAKAFRQIRGLAGGLYGAVLEGFRDECHDSHEARLYLEDRVDTAHQLLRGRGAAGPDAPLMMFQLVFQAEGQKEDTLYYEAAVKVLGNYRDDHENMNTEPGGTPGSTKASVTFCVTEDPSDTKLAGTAITNICRTIKEAVGTKSRPTFALLGNQKMVVFPEDNATLGVQSHSHEKHRNYVSLTQILNTASANLPWKPRLQLSLRLASSLLQLLQTPWLTRAWHKDAVFFLASDPAPGPGPTSGAKRPAPVDLSRPFVVCNFSGASSPQGGPSETETRAALLELGIILLEIWHGMTLEAHFGLDESKPESDKQSQPQPTKYFERLAQALEWEADWTNPMPGLFGETVSQCLRGNNVSAGKKLDWEDLSVWSSICSDIIEPLSKLYKNF